MGGTKLGALLEVGSTVGAALVGSADGVAVDGAGDGSTVGVFVGSNEGNAVGVSDGRAEGATVGTPVTTVLQGWPVPNPHAGAATDGTNVGTELGRVDGTSDGTRVGDSDGVKLGTYVGTSVGMNVVGMSVVVGCDGVLDLGKDDGTIERPIEGI